jgi:hypothetical protein
MTERRWMDAIFGVDLDLAEIVGAAGAGSYVCRDCRG